MNKTKAVLEYLYHNPGGRTNEVANHLKMDYNVASGILSTLKKKGKVYNKDAKWYMDTPENVIAIISRLKDICIEGLHCAWSEGYLSALADYHVISEFEFDVAMNLLKKGGK